MFAHPSFSYRSRKAIPVSTSTTIRVVTQRNWMVEELRAAMVDTGWTVQQHYGMSAPPRDGAISWMPGAFAARLHQQDACPRLSSPGGEFLSLMPQEFTGREVALFPAALAMLEPSEGFWKLADSKDDRFSAAWRTAEQLAADLLAARVPPEAMLHLTDVRLDLVAEYRAVVAGSSVLTGSFYIDLAGRRHDDPDFAVPPSLTHRAAAAFAAEVVAAMNARGLSGPPSYTLDVGFDRVTGRWVVVEANPIWSSAWYGSNPTLFVTAMITDQMTDPGIWIWKPDPVLLARAGRKPPLPPAIGA